MSTIYVLEFSRENYDQWLPLLRIMLEWVDAIEWRIDTRQQQQVAALQMLLPYMIGQVNTGQHMLVRARIAPQVRDYLFSKPYLYDWSHDSPEHPSFLNHGNLVFWTNSYTPTVFFDLTPERMQLLRDKDFLLEPLPTDVMREATLRHR